MVQIKIAAVFLLLSAVAIAPAVSRPARIDDSGSTTLSVESPSSPGSSQHSSSPPATGNHQATQSPASRSGQLEPGPPG